MALFDRLAALPLFAKLDPEVLRALAESARILPRLHAGERIYDVGNPSDALFVLVPGLAGSRPGTVLLELPVGDGRPVRIDRVIEGESSVRRNCSSPVSPSGPAAASSERPPP